MSKWGGAAALLLAGGASLYFALGSPEQPGPSPRLSPADPVLPARPAADSMRQVRAVPAPVASPGKAGGVLARKPGSFERSDDVLSFVQDRLASGTIGDLLEAKAGIGLCSSVEHSSERLGVFAGGGTGAIEGPLTAERQTAALQLMRRCAGFMRAGVVADLSAQVDKLLLAQGRRPETDASSDADIRSALLSGFAPDVHEALAMVLPSWQATLEARGQPYDAEAFGRAIQLAACDLGRDCSQQGAMALMACVYENRCGTPLDELPAKGGDVAQAGLVQQYRREITQAIRQGNVGYFGL